MGTGNRLIQEGESLRPDQWLARINNDLGLRPKDRVHIAQLILNSEIERGFDYGDWYAAKIVKKQVKRAAAELRGLSLT